MATPRATPSMTTYRRGDFVLVGFPFSSGGQAKNRPALVVLDTGDADVVVARVTTQPHSSASDVVVVDWQAAGLLAPSIIRLHKLATLDKQLIHGPLGRLRQKDVRRV